MLGSRGVAMAWSETARCRDDAGVGEEYDLEGDAPHRRAEPEGLSKGGGAEQAGHEGG